MSAFAASGSKSNSCQLVADVGSNPASCHGIEARRSQPCCSQPLVDLSPSRPSWPRATTTSAGIAPSVGARLDVGSSSGVTPSDFSLIASSTVKPCLAQRAASLGPNRTSIQSNASSGLNFRSQAPAEPFESPSSKSREAWRGSWPRLVRSSLTASRSAAEGTVGGHGSSSTGDARWLRVRRSANRRPKMAARWDAVCESGRVLASS